MTTKILKFQSVQAGPWDVSNNKADIVIPSYTNYCDLSRSCILLNLKLLKSDGSDLGLQDASFSNGLDASCLIKNCSFSSDVVGSIEDVPSLNVLNANLDRYVMDFEDQRCAKTFGFDNQNNIGTFLRKDKSGDSNSLQETYLQIPLSRLFGIGETSQFPSNMMGNCKIHLEFEDDAVNVIPKLFQKQTDPTVVSVTKTNATVASFTSNLQQNFNFYVGQPVVTAEDSVGNNQVQQKITAISYDGSKTNITLTPGDNANAWNILYADDTTGTDNNAIKYQINDVQLKLYQYNVGPSQVQSMNSRLKNGLTMEYMTYSLERVNLPTISANATYDRQFDIEPNCVNAFAVIPIDSVANYNPFLTRRDNINSYRWRLNGIDTTDRDIVPFQSLYHDRLMASLTSGRVKVKNLRLFNSEGGNQVKDSNLMIPQPIPLSEKPQVLQLRTHQNATGGTASRTLHLYKQVQKQIRLKGQQVMVV